MNHLEILLEQVLILRAQLGDPGAFERLVERYHSRITYYLRRLIGEEDSVKDVLQEVWLIVFRQLPRLRSVEAFSVWLYRIARNQAVGFLRKRRIYEELNEEIQEPANVDEEINLAIYTAAQIHAALGQLRPEHKEILVLKFLENMSYQEIASVIDRPIGTVRSRIYYAKSALRKILEDVNHDSGTEFER